MHRGATTTQKVLGELEGGQVVQLTATRSYDRPWRSVSFTSSCSYATKLGIGAQGELHTHYKGLKGRIANTKTDSIWQQETNLYTMPCCIETICPWIHPLKLTTVERPEFSMRTISFLKENIILGLQAEPSLLWQHAGITFWMWNIMWQL